jgi:hypothetical protein
VHQTILCNTNRTLQAEIFPCCVYYNTRSQSDSSVIHKFLTNKSLFQLCKSETEAGSSRQKRTHCVLQYALINLFFIGKFSCVLYILQSVGSYTSICMPLFTQLRFTQTNHFMDSSGLKRLIHASCYKEKLNKRQDIEKNGICCKKCRCITFQIENCCRKL